MLFSVKTIHDDIPKMQVVADELNGRSVEIGAHGENAWLSGIHEFGCRIKVTKKMRAWFARNGYPLKKTTTEIVIPERSFLRGGMDEYGEAIIEEYSKLTGNVLSGSVPAEVLLEGIGQELATKIKTYARNLSEPPNSAMTVQRKGSSNPLVDTGTMIDSINYEVK